ncbi:hypothetical protein P3S67_018996 [Capsicum chacoense]|uniref:uncharacterized protein LOC124886684 n=1 Tax=Capsicum annuum TaxID=4072 RepID=UPI001FB11E86|nr:uncharacterized protein LOC124886684 [Capsicum annuum]
MANEDSPSFSLGISQIETQKSVHDSNHVLSFTPDNFDYTKLGFSENRSKQRNDPEKLKILREAFAAKNLTCKWKIGIKLNKFSNLRRSSKVISIATTNARDLGNILSSLTDNDATRVIGKLIAERSNESDVYVIAYEPEKNERIKGILGIILDTIQKNEIIFV